MKVTIYHNPRCSKSREALSLITGAGHNPVIIEYLKTGLNQAVLANLLEELNISDPRGLMRTKETEYKSRALGAPDKERDALLAALIECPALLERPIVITEKGAMVCRPPEKVHALL